MNNKIFIIILAICVFLSINVAFASQFSNETLEMHESALEKSIGETSYDDPVKEFQNFDSNEQNFNENNLNSPNNDSFSDLQNLIDSSDSETITLDKNYVFDMEKDSSYMDGMIIEDKNIIIEGNGFTLDGAGQSRIFKLINSQMTINNLNLINGNNLCGSAIYAENTQLTINNSQFTNNIVNVTNYIYQNESIVTVSDIHGGAIYSDDDINCINCNFTDNSIIINNNIVREKDVWFLAYKYCNYTVGGGGN